MRRTMMLALPVVREKLAKLVNVDADEIVMVPNTTHGINTILRNFEWKQEDWLMPCTSCVSYSSGPY
jgi:selenocysteine lyase/cysteine desulfurase